MIQGMVTVDRSSLQELNNLRFFSTPSILNAKIVFMKTIRIPAIPSFVRVIYRRSIGIDRAYRYKSDSEVKAYHEQSRRRLN